MKILLVEPYFGGSHRAWAEGLAAHSVHDVHLLTLPDRFWTWRMRGGAITLAQQTGEWVAEHGPPDLILATDMLDVPQFLGQARRFVKDAPVAVYFHESQFTYPWSPQLRPDLQYAYLNWASMRAANLVLFNSQFHRDVVFEELPRFLRQFPDFTHESLIGSVSERSAVLPVGVDLARIDRIPPDRGGEPPLILWNQRWEHDKDPASMFRAMFALQDDGIDFRLAVCGENQRQQPEEFVEAERRLAPNLVHFGYAPESVYIGLLRSADIVVSTALHEFFGVAVVEAMYAGAAPVLPNRLVYPEIVPAEVHDQVLYEDGALLPGLRSVLADRSLRNRVVERVSSSLGRFDWAKLIKTYDSMLSSAGSSSV